MIPRIPVVTLEDCERICNQDAFCNFIFHIPGQDGPEADGPQDGPRIPPRCMKFRSCNETRDTPFVGSTYSKYGVCPSTKF